MRSNWKHALLALALALVAWYFVSGREKVDLWVDCAVQYSGIPEGLAVHGGLVSKLEVRVRAPRGLLRTLEEKKLTYNVDLSRIREGRNVLPIEAESMPLSRTFEVVDVSPGRLELAVDRIVTKEVTIKPVAKGPLDASMKVLEMTAEPAAVKIRGPEYLLKTLTQVETQPVPLPLAEVGQSEEVVALALPEELKVEPGTVTVRVVVALKTKPMTFKVGIDVENRSGYPARVRPSKVDVLVDVPVSLLKDVSLKDKLAVKLVLGPDLAPGVYALTPETSLFFGGKVVKITPETVEAQIREQRPGG
jgi:YbbR domain-containing protein